MGIGAGPVSVLVSSGSLMVPCCLLRGRTRSATATLRFRTCERTELLPRHTQTTEAQAVVTCRLGRRGFRVQLDRIQGGRVQLFAQRVQRLSIHYRAVGVEAVYLILGLLWRRGLGRGSFY